MNTQIKKTIEALYVIISVFIIGLAFPVLVSAFVSITTEATLSDCITSAPFWIFTILGWIISAVYINDSY